MRTLLIILLACLFLSACASPSSPVGSPMPPELPGSSEVQTIRSDAARRVPPSAAQSRVGDLVAGTNEFAFDFYRQAIAERENNLIFSPFSLSLAFSMVYGGARGETEAQLAEVFGYLPQEAQHPAFNRLESDLSALGQAETQSGDGQDFQLEIANALWGQQGFPFEADYLDLLAAQYGAGLRAVDFAGSPEASRQAINRRVEQQTNERIQDLMPAGSINSGTRLALANAIYFKASWQQPFSESKTREAPFSRLDGSQVTAPLMHGVMNHIQYSQGDGYRTVRLPYLGGPVEMLLLVPDAGRYEEIEAQLSAEFFRNVLEESEERQVTLDLPRFDFESSMDLIEHLKGLGLRAPFEDADFSGISDGGDLFIAAAVHKADITLDEKGTEASAATGIAMAESAPPPAELRVDRPFIFAIYERDSGAILFLGRVLDPTVGE